MTKFIYSMQNILDLKIKLEEQAKIAFSMANLRLREEEQKKEQILQEMVRYEEIIRGFQTKRLDLLEMKRCKEAIELKKEEAKKQEQVILNAKRNVELSRKKLNDVMVERKTQEILREKALEEYKKELEAEEKKITDEIVSYQFKGKDADYA